MELDTLDFKIFKGKYLTHVGELNDCNLRLAPFIINKEKIIHYTILPHENVESGDDIEISPSERGIQGHVYNYDEVSPNPILYFDEDGMIVFCNDKMKSLNDPTSGKKSIDSLFLESELGPLMENLDNHIRKDKQVMVRMILKAQSGMVEGYSRLSVHGQDQAPGKYRLEFVVAKEAQLVDRQLEDILDELDRLKSEVRETKSTLINEQMEDFSFENIVTKSPKYKATLRQVAQVADTDTTVLITGETGTGKELLCDATYKLSDRSDKRMIKVNCASIPHELVESILFGHEKGSFTGAESQKIGKFEMANGGTIFLDEIGEMPLELQPKLLRVLQEGEIERIGNPNPIKIDVRVIAATNRDLNQMCKEGTFRSDLYYRLNVFPIYNIPLRERLEDVPYLINHFIKKMNIKAGKKVSSIRNKDIETLSKYSFPGNVRELENIIERSIILSEGEELNMDFFYESPKDPLPASLGFQSYDDIIKSHLILALEQANGKVTGEASAADLLQLNGKTFASKLRKYGIDPKFYKRK